MEELKDKAMSLCSDLIQNVQKEFEKSGLEKHGGNLQKFKLNVKKDLEELLNEVKVKTVPPISNAPTPSMATKPTRRNELKSTTSTPALVIQFGKLVRDNDESSVMDRYAVDTWRNNFPSGHVIMGELLNGNCRVTKAPAVFGWHPDGKLVCMKAAIRLATSSDSQPEIWECNNRSEKRLRDVRSGEQEKMHIFSPEFLTSFLIQEMKPFCKSGTPSTLTTSIITFPLLYTCKQRAHLKEAAKLAGFENIYLLSEEGLTAYYWFSKRVELQHNNKFSKNIAIVTCGTSSFVMYRRLFELQENGQKKMIVEAVHSVPIQTETHVLFQRLKEKGISGSGYHIPVLCKYVDNTDPQWLEFRQLLKNAHSNDFSLEILKNEEINYYAVRAATLLSDNPEDFKRSIRNTLGNTVLIGVEEAIASYQFLPETCSMITHTIKHYTNPHKLTAYYTSGKSWMGDLWVIGVKIGAELKVTFELTWEGIWKVADVKINKNDWNGDVRTWFCANTPAKADKLREYNGFSVRNVWQLETNVGVHQEKSKDGTSNGSPSYTETQNETSAATEDVAVGGRQNVKKRLALTQLQPNEDMMSIRSAKKIKLGSALVEAEQDVMTEEDLHQKIKESVIEKLIVEVDPSLWDMEHDFED